MLEAMLQHTKKKSTTKLDKFRVRWNLYPKISRQLQTHTHTRRTRKRKKCQTYLRTRLKCSLKHDLWVSEIIVVQWPESSMISFLRQNNTTKKKERRTNSIWWFKLMIVTCSLLLFAKNETLNIYKYVWDYE